MAQVLCQVFMMHFNVSVTDINFTDKETFRMDKLFRIGI